MNRMVGEAGHRRDSREASSLRMWRTLVGPVVGSPGPAHVGDLGFIDVPADHADPGRDAPFALRFARFLAKRDAGLPPVFYLYGGPDPSGDLWQLLDGDGPRRAAAAVLIDTVTDYCDLVLVDHRGSWGCAYPKLVPLRGETWLPLDRPVPLEEREAAQTALYEDLIARWAAAGVDLDHITTPQLAGDLDQLRRALGYHQIVLMGDSNGTYRAREYLRQHQDTVASALLFISHGYQKVPRPAHVRAALARIDAALASDPIANRHLSSMTALLDDLSQRLGASPLRTAFRQADGAEAQIVLDEVDLASFFWSLCGDTAGIRRAPGELWRLARGDSSALGAHAAKARHLGHAGLDAYSLAFAGAAMPNALEALAYRDEAGGARYLNRLHEADCEYAWPLVRDPRPVFTHRVAVTYVMGEWDLRTPIEGLSPVRSADDTLVINSCQGHDSGIDGDGGPVWEEPILRAFLEGRTPPPRPTPEGSFGIHFS